MALAPHKCRDDARVSSQIFSSSKPLVIDKRIASMRSSEKIAPGLSSLAAAQSIIGEAKILSTLVNKPAREIAENRAA